MMEWNAEKILADYRADEQFRGTVTIASSDYTLGWHFKRAMVVAAGLTTGAGLSLGVLLTLGEIARALFGWGN